MSPNSTNAEKKRIRNKVMSILRKQTPNKEKADQIMQLLTDEMLAHMKAVQEWGRFLMGKDLGEA